MVQGGGHLRQISVAITVPAFFSARSMSGVIFSTSSCISTPTACRRRVSSPPFSREPSWPALRRFLHVGERLRAAHQGLRHGLGKTLRLLAMAGTSHLLGHCVACGHRDIGPRCPAPAATRPADEQDAGVRWRDDRAAPEQRPEMRLGFLDGIERVDRASCVTLSGSVVALRRRCRTPASRLHIIGSIDASGMASLNSPEFLRHGSEGFLEKQIGYFSTTTWLRTFWGNDLS